MKVEYHGTGKNRHATVWDDAGEWVATVRAGREAEAIDALAVGANRGAEILKIEEPGAL